MRFNVVKLRKSFAFGEDTGHGCPLLVSPPAGIKLPNLMNLYLKLANRIPVILSLLLWPGQYAVAQNVGIGTASPTARLHIAGNQKIDSTYTLEFGAGMQGKENNAGKIGYQVFTPSALDIVWAGTTTNGRKITFWAEGGALFRGAIVANGDIITLGNVNVDNDLTVTGTINAGLTYVSADYILSSGNLGLYTIACPGGTRLVSGGGGHRDFNTAAADISVSYSGPDISAPLTNWRLIVLNSNGSASRTIRIYCTCARIN